MAIGDAVSAATTGASAILSIVMRGQFPITQTIVIPSACVGLILRGYAEIVSTAGLSKMFDIQATAVTLADFTLDPQDGAALAAISGLRCTLRNLRQVTQSKVGVPPITITKSFAAVLFCRSLNQASSGAVAIKTTGTVTSTQIIGNQFANANGFDTSSGSIGVIALNTGIGVGTQNPAASDQVGLNT